MVSLGVALGLWQWDRAIDKRDWLARLEAAPSLESPWKAPPEGASVTLRGEYLHDHTRYLDNRIVEGRVGVAVLTPLRDEEGRLWLIQRGFVPTGPVRTDPEVETPAGAVRIDGQWQPAKSTSLLFGPNEEGRRLQQISLAPWVSLGEFAHRGWLHLEEGPGKLTPWWQPSVMPPSRHFGYAVQWWGLALAALAVMLIGGRRIDRTAAPRIRGRQA